METDTHTHTHTQHDTDSHDTRLERFEMFAGVTSDSAPVEQRANMMTHDGRELFVGFCVQNCICQRTWNNLTFNAAIPFWVVISDTVLFFNLYSRLLIPINQHCIHHIPDEPMRLERL